MLMISLIITCDHKGIFVGALSLSNYTHTEIRLGRISRRIEPGVPVEVFQERVDFAVMGKAEAILGVSVTILD